MEMNICIFEAILNALNKYSFPHDCRRFSYAQVFIYLFIFLHFQTNVLISKYVSFYSFYSFLFVRPTVEQKFQCPELGMRATTVNKLSVLFSIVITGEFFFFHIYFYRERQYYVTMPSTNRIRLQSENYRCSHLDEIRIVRDESLNPIVCVSRLRNNNM